MPKVETPPQSARWTIMGNWVDLKNPDPETIRIGDIAHSLARICRFTGHVESFYSVAQHSVLVAQRLCEDGYSATTCMHGLLHDAHEAYIGDLPRPMRAVDKELTFWWDEIADRVQTTILIAFDLPMPTDAKINAVRSVDDQALATEWRDVCGCAEPMPGCDAKPWPGHIKPYGTLGAAAFVAEYVRLFNARNE